MKIWLLTWSSHNKGKNIAGVVTPPTVGLNLSDMENQGDNGSHKCVKNGFSDTTKEKIGWDQCRKDITNDHQGKALKEGYHEREWAQTGVSPTEDTSTK